MSNPATAWTKKGTGATVRELTNAIPTPKKDTAQLTLDAVGHLGELLEAHGADHRTTLSLDGKVQEDDLKRIADKKLK